MGLRTALYDSHLALKARMVDFGGWDMPVQYEGVLAEHARVRTDVGMFDTSHMDAFWLEGPDSLDVFSRMVTQDLRTLAVGSCRYGFMLNEAGGVLDDLIVYRMNETQWMPVVNAETALADFAWVRRGCEGTRTTVQDLRDKQGKLDVQGPKARATLTRVFGIDLADLKRFRWQRATVGAAEWIISRTGYTGEDGVEIYAPPTEILFAWQKLLDAGVKPCGLGARDTLRLEAGLPLYGHEFDAATSPAEAGFLRYCTKADTFIGKESLLQRAEKTDVRLVPFLLEGRQTARNGQAVRLASGENIGRVTSGSFCPTVGLALGFAYVALPYGCPGARWFVDNGRALLPATVAELPFLKTSQP